MIDGAISEKGTIKDVCAMSEIVKNMQDCPVAIEYMYYMCDLDAVHRLKDIVCCLPSQLQRSWAEKAEATRWGYREADLENVIGYLVGQARIADGRIGHLARSIGILTRQSISQLQYAVKDRGGL